jgi:hypothetical protein
MTYASKRAQRLNQDALEHAVETGVARAIAARKVAGVELTANDIDNVSGGLLFGPIINGGRLADLGLFTTQPQTNVLSPAAQQLGGLQGIAGGAGIGGVAGVQGMVA